MNEKAQRALLLIDLQNDFVDNGSLAVKHGQEVIAVANRIMPSFDVVIATLDWHPYDHQSFASQHASVSVYDNFELDGLSQTAWPDHCIEDTFGAQLVAELNQREVDFRVYKGTDRRIDSYSGFFDNGHRRSTGLSEYLREQKIEQVAILGLATDYCVRFTALDAVKQGFRTLLIEDGCRGVELQHGDIARAMTEMKCAGVELVQSEELLASLAAHTRDCDRELRTNEDDNG